MRGAVSWYSFNFVSTLKFRPIGVWWYAGERPCWFPSRLPSCRSPCYLKEEKIFFFSFLPVLPFFLFFFFFFWSLIFLFSCISFLLPPPPLTKSLPIPLVFSYFLLPLLALFSSASPLNTFAVLVTPVTQSWTRARRLGTYLLDLSNASTKTVTESEIQALFD